MHKDVLIGCDFFTKHVWTLTGPVAYYVLFFIHIASRKVHVAGFTTNPNASAERFVRSIKEECLDRLILFGEASLQRALDNFLGHYHQERPIRAGTISSSSHAKIILIHPAPGQYCATAGSAGCSGSTTAKRLNPQYNLAQTDSSPARSESSIHLSKNSPTPATSGARPSFGCIHIGRVF